MKVTSCRQYTNNYTNKEEYSITLHTHDLEEFERVKKFKDGPEVVVNSVVKPTPVYLTSSRSIGKTKTMEDYIAECIKIDIKNTEQAMYHAKAWSKPMFWGANVTNIEKVIFNNPATIVIWKDGTKTVVKRQKGERWDKEKGLAMAIVKKVFGNKGNYCNLFKKWIDNDQEK